MELAAKLLLFTSVIMILCSCRVPLSQEQAAQHPLGRPSSVVAETSTPLRVISKRSAVISPRDIADGLLRETFVVITNRAAPGADGLGSAFAVTNDVLMTNAHVVAGAVAITVRAVRGNEVELAARVLAVDERRDLALLSVPGLKAEGLPISSVGPEIGDPVYVAGNPDGLLGSFSSGLVSAFRRDPGCMLFQMTAPIAPGSSGGPVVNAEGNLVGVSVGIRGSGENLNFAVHLSEVLSFAQENGFKHPSMPAR